MAMWRCSFDLCEVLSTLVLSCYNIESHDVTLKKVPYIGRRIPNYKLIFFFTYNQCETNDALILYPQSGGILKKANIGGPQVPWWVLILWSRTEGYVGVSPLLIHVRYCLLQSHAAIARDLTVLSFKRYLMQKKWFLIISQRIS